MLTMTFLGAAVGWWGLQRIHKFANFLQGATEELGDKPGGLAGGVALIMTLLGWCGLTLQPGGREGQGTLGQRSSWASILRFSSGVGLEGS